MKSYFILLSAVIFLSCSGGAGKSTKSDATTDAIVNTGGTAVDSSQNLTGINLIASNDCLTCHKIAEQSFGPSYQQVADRYALNQGNVENLAGRIIKGGKGLWGQNAMTPHPNLTEPQAQEMVKYILSLRGSAASSK